MSACTRFAARLLVVLVAVVASFGLDVSTAYAQSASCSRLASDLRTLERNRDFRAAQENARNARALAEIVQDAESAYVRTGCNDLAKAGAQLPRECRNLARQINDGRADYDALTQSLEAGTAIAQQREALLQESARFGCGTGSRVTITEDGRPSRRDNLFEQLFGGFTREGEFADGDIIGDDFSGYGNYHTVRTVCVRLSDGYFWPISYSTLQEYVPNDAAQCQAQCPTAAVDLYYYDNPGQEPEQMVNMYGQPYTALPNAFRYREEYDRASTCKQQAPSGVITLASNGQTGQSRAVIDFGGTDFPLPMRDPRRAAAPADVVPAAVEVAAVESVDVPLPRRRPTAAGGTPIQATPEPTATAEARIVRFGDKRVRIVGPETPYARAGEAGL